MFFAWLLLTEANVECFPLTLSDFLPRRDDVVGGIPVLAEDLLQAEPGALGHVGEHVHGVREDREERADAVAALGVGELAPGSGT